MTLPPTAAQSDGMDLKLIKALVRIMERGEVSELEIEDEKAGLRVRLKRGHGGDVPASNAPVVNLMPGASPVPAGSLHAVPRSADDESEAPPERAKDLQEITSPMVGTFYRAASPDAEPFADVGMEFDEEDTICIIEAMKVMNEIKAECRGTIVEMLVENGEPVEFGQPLFLVKTT